MADEHEPPPDTDDLTAGIAALDASAKHSSVAPLHFASDGRPVIQYRPNRFEPAVREGVVVLKERGDVYVSGGKLVQVAKASAGQCETSRWIDEKGRARYGIVAGSPQITPVSKAVLKMQLSSVASFHKFVRCRSAWEPCAPPDDVVAALDENARNWNLPPLRGIAETPIMRPDGTVASAPGYEPQTGYWLAPSVASFPAIECNPTKREAEGAYRQLAEVFEDFPLTAPGAAAVPIASILTIILRASIRGSVPGFVLDASTGGTGKTLLSDVIAYVTTGRPASRKAYPGDDVECEKVFSSYALRGTPLVSIDDVKRPLGGESLDMVLTARGDVDFRRLGKTELLTMPWVATLLFTGNNVTYFGQMARRVLLARIESRLERPQDRADFRHPKLLEWVASERPRLVAAALTIVRSFICHGRPDADRFVWGSFEEWAALVAPAICFAGGPNVLDHRPEDDGDDEVLGTAALRSILAGLLALAATEAPLAGRAPSDGLTSGEIVAALKRHGTTGDHGPLLAAVHEITRTRPPDVPSPAALGTNLRKHMGRVLRVDGALIRLVKRKDARNNSADRWAVEAL